LGNLNHNTYQLPLLIQADYNAACPYFICYRN